MQLAEVGDGDDDEQVQQHGEKRHREEQDVQEAGLGLSAQCPPAGGVEQQGVAEVHPHPRQRAPQ